MSNLIAIITLHMLMQHKTLIHPSIHLSIHLTHQSIHPPTNTSIHPPVHPSSLFGAANEPSGATYTYTSPHPIIVTMSLFLYQNYSVLMAIRSCITTLVMYFISSLCLKTFPNFTLSILSCALFWLKYSTWEIHDQGRTLRVGWSSWVCFPTHGKWIFDICSIKKEVM